MTQADAWTLERIGQLPSVAFKDRHQIPELTCVYFVLDGNGRPLYIGSSAHLRSRWGIHRLRETGEEAGAERIAWFECEFCDAVHLEVDLIYDMKPPLNVRGKARRMKPPRLPWEWD